MNGDCPIVASSSDSEVANGSTEELDIGVAGTGPGPVKKVRVWSSEVRERAIRVIWRIQLVLVSQENTITIVSSCEEDSEYFSHKSITTLSMKYITAT